MTTYPCGTRIATPPERIAAMAYIDHITDQSGGATTRAQLEAFTFGGQAITLIDPAPQHPQPRDAPRDPVDPDQPPLRPRRPARTRRVPPLQHPHRRPGPLPTSANSMPHSNWKSRSSGFRRSRPAMRPDGGTGSRRTDRSSIRKPWASPLRSRTRPPTPSNTGARHVTVLGGRASAW
jgi:hypothetical protein